MLNNKVNQNNKPDYISITGRREQNEDRHNIELNLNGADKKKSPVNFYAIYDGHGGKFVSTFLSKTLPSLFMTKKISYPLKKDYIIKAYKLLQNILETKYRAHAENVGSTALVCIQTKTMDSEHVYIFNTGDCRAVLCRDNLATVLSKDHKPHWPEEKYRIEALGGVIKYDGNDYRVKDLSVSRAFGDISATPYVTCVPDIYRYRLDKSDLFIILACDGLWDVLSSQDAVNFVLMEAYDKDFKRKNKNINVARKLSEYALAMGSMDNITCIVIFLKNE
jgi:serine/threonine protein phosphatase PrpC